MNRRKERSFVNGGKGLMDKIRIQDLEIFAKHGALPEENVLGQKFLVSAVLYLDTRAAGKSDDLTASIHYGEVCHRITEYMQEHIGEIYEGVISGITSWGMYVELPSTVEGLIHVSNLYDDRYYYQEESHEMVGVDTGTVYKLGQSIQVRVLGADKQTRTIDFVPDAKEDWEDR